MPSTLSSADTANLKRSASADFAAHCCELLGSLGRVEAQRMFLGWGLSVEGLTVAVIAWDTLYLKAHDASQARFLEAGGRIFEHRSKDRVRRMQYYTVPEAALESREAMRPWAQLAMEAAVAARKPPSSKVKAKAGTKASTQGRTKADAPTATRPARKRASTNPPGG